MKTEFIQVVIGDSSQSSIAFATVVQSLANSKVLPLETINPDTPFLWVWLGASFDDELWNSIRTNHDYAYLVTLPLRKSYACLHYRADILELMPTNLIGSCVQQFNQRLARDLRTHRFVANALAIRWHSLPYRIMELMEGGITEEVIEQIERLENCVSLSTEEVESDESERTRRLDDFLSHLTNDSSVKAISAISDVYRNVDSTTRDQRKRRLINPHKEIVKLARYFHSLLAEKSND